MKKSSIAFFVFICLFTFKGIAQQGVVYVTDQNGEPWGSQSNFQALNAVFGNAYDTAYYQNANVNAIFSNSNCLVYIEGGMNSDISRYSYNIATSLYICFS